MFTVKECTQNEHACDMCDGIDTAYCKLKERFKANVGEGDRIFVLTESEPKALGVLGLGGGKVIVKGVFGDIDESYRDVMYRSLLNVCRGFNPITVRVEGINPYFKRFGFSEQNGGMEINSRDIKFCNH